MMSNVATLYEQDFYGWIQHHIGLLQQRKFADLDVDLLIEELDSLAKRDKQELVSHFIILLAHLLKWLFQLQSQTELWQTFQGHSWRSSIREQRVQILNQLETSPSLKPHLLEAVTKAYPKAVKLARDETGFPMKAFPDTCPYTLVQLLDKRFLP
jgi:hypothetical protein